MVDSNTSGFLTQEIAEVHARTNAVLDATPRPPKMVDGYCDTCELDEFDCECCPTGEHVSIYDDDCMCFRDKELQGETMFGHFGNNADAQMGFGTALQPMADDKKPDEGKYCTCPLPFPPFKENTNICSGCNLPDKQAILSSSKPAHTPEPPHPMHPPTKVIEGQGWSIWCGKGDHVKPHANDFDIVLNLTGRSILEKHSIPVPELSKWSNGGYSCTEVMLDWPDYGTVSLPLAFWQDLLAHVEKNKMKLVVFCVGGHGRTGTAVASMLVTKGLMSGEEAITWVRTNYCHRAIESKGQEDYILALSKKIGK